MAPRARIALALAAALTSCAHGVDISESPGELSPSPSHDGGSAASMPEAPSGTGGASVDPSSGASGTIGGGGVDNADAGIEETSPIGDAQSSSDDAPAAPDANEGGHPTDAAPPDGGCPSPVACSLRATLIHRYAFDGMGTTAVDSIGKANGTLVNTRLTGTGSVVLAGGTTDQYVDLPNKMISGLTNATFEVWLTWDGGAYWQRIFDFGIGDSNMENVRGAAASTIHMTPSANGSSPALRFAFKRANQTVPQETDLEASMPLASGVVVHVAGVVDDTNNKLYLYRDGALQGSKAFTDSLSLIDDVNNWLGRSQYAADPALGAAIHEFRIYNVALSAAQIQASFSAGQNPPYLAK